MDILADTGVLLRFMEPSDPDRLVITDAIEAIFSRGDRIVFGPQNAAEFMSASTRPRTVRGGFGLSHAEASRRLDDLETSFPMLFDDRYAYGIWRSLITRHAVMGKQVHDARLVTASRTS